MNIISDFFKDIQTENRAPGTYEWWYFDAVSESGYSIVIIFYEGNPFSKRYIQSLERNRREKADQFPAISISLYKDGEPQFYSFEEAAPRQASFSDLNPEGKVKENTFTGRMEVDRVRFSVLVDQTLPNGDRLAGELLFQSEAPEKLKSQFKSGGPASGHTWNLVQPKCSVDGVLHLSGFKSEKIKFQGTGYHDHNSGCEPMKDMFGEWYWGRYHFEEATFIYYIMNQQEKWTRKAWLIEDSGEVSKLDESIILKDSSYSIFGLHTSKKIEFKGPGAELFLQKEMMIDNGPFYQRFKGLMVMHRGGKIYRSEGISEYIKPNRIYSKIFRPLVDMRIKYPGKANWVQKSRLLYRWTW